MRFMLWARSESFKSTDALITGVTAASTRGNTSIPHPEIMASVITAY